MQLAGAFRHSSSIVAILSVDDGTFVDVNPMFERVLGWSAGEIRGRRPLELQFWPDPDVRSVIWGHLRSGAGIVDLSVRCRARDGTTLRGRLDSELIDLDGRVVVFNLLREVHPDTEGPRSARIESESYRTLVEAAAEGLYRSLPNGRFTEVNPAMARLFGYGSPQEMLQNEESRVTDVYVDPTQRMRVHAEANRAGTVQQVQSEMRRRDGSRLWISENVRAVRGADDVLLFYEGTVVDITEQVLAEQALQQSETLYQVLVDNCRDGVFLIQRGKVVFANRAMAAMLGYPDAELIGIAYMELVAPHDREAQMRRRSAREAGSNAVQQYDLHMVRKDGRQLLCQVRADAVQYRGDIASTGLVRDITEERRQQAALKEAEQRYRELFEQSPAGLFRTSMKGAILEVNPQLAQMLGYDSPDELKQRRSMLDLYADPAERDGILRRLASGDGLDNYETQVVGRDGQRLWVSGSVRVMRPEDGSEPLFSGSVLDINARRRAEEELLRSELKYRTLVEHSQVGVFISRGERYVYANRRLAEMLGYGEEELLQIKLHHLVAPEYLPAARERLQRIAAGLVAPMDFENCYLCKDGSRIHVTVSIGEIVLDGETPLTGTVRDITKQREAEQRLRFHATHDSLTGLPNRALFQRRLDEAIVQARSEERLDYAVLFLDLDGFKLVNDSLGHAAGDRLLVVVGELLTRTLSEDALVARYGGDEFTILPHGPCNRVRAENLASRILGLFDAPFDLDGHQAFSGASLGIVLGHPDYRKHDQVLRDADTAMYRAKAGGKSGYVFFDEAMHAAARQRFHLETDFRLAFERDEFRVHYQPVVSLQNGSLLGFEALVRWLHPTRGLIGPGEFLHVAEESGLIAVLDWWVMQRACADLAAWQRRYPRRRALGVSVNVDERQVSSPDVEARLRSVLQSSGIAAADLTLEITETVFRSGRGPANATLERLKAVGVRLAVDDFGTGYSSLDSFSSAPFDKLKIDQSFIRDVEINPRHRALVRTIASLAEDLGLELTAEGVETVGQARVLLAMGCQQAQGFLYSPAMPPEQVEDLLAGGYLLPRAAAFA